MGIVVLHIAKVVVLSYNQGIRTKNKEFLYEKGIIHRI